MELHIDIHLHLNPLLKRQAPAAETGLQQGVCGISVGYPQDIRGKPRQAPAAETGLRQGVCGIPVGYFQDTRGKPRQDPAAETGLRQSVSGLPVGYPQDTREKLRQAPAADWPPGGQLLAPGCSAHLLQQLQFTIPYNTKLNN